MISIKTFYLIGVFVMGIAVIGSLINFSLTYKFMNIGGIISFIFGSIILQILFMCFFYFLYKTTPEMNATTPDLDDILKDIQGGELNGIRKKEKN